IPCPTPFPFPLSFSRSLASELRDQRREVAEVVLLERREAVRVVLVLAADLEGQRALLRELHGPGQRADHAVLARVAEVSEVRELPFDRVRLVHVPRAL